MRINQDVEQDIEQFVGLRTTKSKLVVELTFKLNIDVKRHIISVGLNR